MDIENRLLTTGVFSHAKVEIKETTGSSEHHLLVQVEEKWTLMPVFRGQWGGGTPLKVLGAYDTHLLGRLLTFGGEFRQYGQAPVGGVLYMRAPRWLDGHHLIGGEVWKNERQRFLYNDQASQVASIHDRSYKARFHYFQPMTFNPHIKLGLDLSFLRTRQLSLEAKKDAFFGSFIEENTDSFYILPTFLFDNMTKQNLLYDGHRVFFRLGHTTGERDKGFSGEVEWFYYYLFKNMWNFASHFFLGVKENQNLASGYFLGGFDSIRGVPDSILYGPKAFYTNIEMRKLWKPYRYLWCQGVGFFDIGAVKNDLPYRKMRSSVGGGIRFYVPQATRVMLRFDVAWSLDKPGIYGFSVGMNQFFQPYRPL